MSEFRNLFEQAVIGARMRANVHYLMLWGAPNPHTLNGYSGAMQDLMSRYHLGAVHALQTCNAHDSESENAPRVLLFGLYRECWENRVSFPDALNLCSMFLRKCARTLYSADAVKAQ